MTLSYDDALARDAADPLGGYRDAFHRHADPVAYLDGNSLGRPPKATLDRVTRAIDRDWGERLIRGWEEGWSERAETLGNLLASACLGAAPGQTVVTDSTSVNLYKVVYAACDLQGGRDEIVIDDGNFPTDRYLVESVARARGMYVRWLSPDPIAGVTHRDLSAALSPQTAVVVLSHVDYRSGAIADLPGLTRLAHDAGALVVWDVCHSAGVLPIDLDRFGVDFAVGCTYKYLNAGPGAPAFLYVAARLLPDVRQPIPGWWSARDVFAMADTYEPALDARRMLSGSPNILGMIGVEEGVRLVERAGIDAIRAKAADLTGMCVDLVDAWLAPRGFAVVSPRDAAARGGHVSIQGPGARKLRDKMVAAGVIPDFRNPDTIRLGLSPLSTSYAELWTAMDTIRSIVGR
ncbi:kynureninase [Solicola gregarius]|uniref:Kynureninase n=1 Tax=Solicola gregarius TaxID=2908642 RepID=A0AA46YJF9_9ACTN|nr:aminotransferase class V-fold PLP-dependent enzyme [Solicola gregarius]UYM04500.1 aminotransferase class V-fold PLP-dependent enzyme [Solicola gregarius]